MEETADVDRRDNSAHRHDRCVQRRQRRRCEHASRVLDLYRRPVAESDNPIAPLAIIRMAADGPEHPTAEVLRAIDTYLAQLDVPAEIVWGVNDPFFGDRLDDMIVDFPNAPVTLTDPGHFLQEEVEAPDEIAATIQRVREKIES